MKITQCKYGHYYDKAYFAKCPHCYRKNGGRDEDIIIKDVKLTANLSDTNQITKTQDKRESNRKNVKRWIGEAWDELEEILADEESEPEEKERQQHKKKNESYKTGELLTGNVKNSFFFSVLISISLQKISSSLYKMCNTAEAGNIICAGFKSRILSWLLKASIFAPVSHSFSGKRQKSIQNS